VFHSWRTGNRDVFVMNAEGGDLVRVTTDSVHDMYPDFAPDGKRVVYNHLVNTTQSIASPRASGGLYVSEQAANDQWSARALVTVSSSMARWAHDGKMVVFLSAGALNVVDAEGGPPRRLATNEQLNGVLISTAVGPDLSVVYARAVDSTGVHSFYAVDRVSGKPRLLMRLNDPRRRARRHEFATDSKRLYFTLSEDESDIWVTELRKP
jgi:dipeptidyl aminopeptidase/acylaminoacyl peptidase